MSVGVPADNVRLTAEQQRVLGALMEKQQTVPDSYPLSLNALRTACNQSSSREPVVDYDDETIGRIVRELRELDLVRFVWVHRSSRTAKYHQLLTETLGLDAPQTAVITVLLLRGPQAPGALKTRTERLHPFPDRADVEAVLADLAAREPALVRELPRQAGQHDRRWLHLLGDPPTSPEGPAPITLVDREAVLTDGAQARDDAVLAGYEGLASTDDIEGRWPLDPFEEWFLGQVADAAADGPVIDLGTGSGTAAGVLAEYGLDVTGLDISPAMLELARTRFPGIHPVVGDLRRVLRPPTAPGWGAVVCRRVLGHLAGSELPPAVGAASRVLSPGGAFGLVVDVGDTVVPLPGTDLTTVLHDPHEVLAAVTGGGLTLVDWYLCGPEKGEAGAKSLHVLARR